MARRHGRHRQPAGAGPASRSAARRPAAANGPRGAAHVRAGPARAARPLPSGAGGEPGPAEGAPRSSSSSCGGCRSRVFVPETLCENQIKSVLLWDPTGRPLGGGGAPRTAPPHTERQRLRGGLAPNQARPKTSYSPSYTARAPPS